MILQKVADLKRVLSLLIAFALLTACQSVPATQPSLTPTPTSASGTCGGRIAFNSTRDGHSEVYLMRADGTEQTRLTIFKTGENFVSTWSPNRTWIAFVSKQGDEAQVYITKEDGSHQVNLTNAYLTSNFDAAVLPPLEIAHNAGDFAPGQIAESIRTTLFDAQLKLGDDSALAAQKITETQKAYSDNLANPIKTASPTADTRVWEGFAAAVLAVGQKDAQAFAAARSQVWTSILLGGYAVVEDALKRGDGPTARTWLSVREFRTMTTRFSRPNVDATLAVDSFAQGVISQEIALGAVRTDLLDTYQGRLNQALSDLAKANVNGFKMRSAELAALAQGYFLILAPAYTEQRGVEALQIATATFANLRASAVSGNELTASMKQADEALRNFRAAPLSASDQVDRSAQMMRYLLLVAVEYERGVENGQVIRDFEIQEAIAFQAGAYAAFSDLGYLLDPAKVVQADALFRDLDHALAEAAKQTTVAHPDEVQSQVEALAALLSGIMPEEWMHNTPSDNDFKVYDSEPAWSPNSRKIALSSNNDGANLELASDLNIYMMNANGTGATKLTKDQPKYNGAPAWSPDGNKLIFVSDRDQNLEVYLMNADGSGQTNLTNSAGIDQSPAWSPDGSKILFVSERDGNSEIYVINADGSGLKNLTNRSSNDISPAWSPDGTKIVFVANENGKADIYVMNVDGSGQINLTNTPTANDLTPKWSPDGSQIVFVTNRDGNAEIYMMNADGSEQTNLTNHPSEDTNPIWEP